MSVYQTYLTTRSLGLSFRQGEDLLHHRLYRDFSADVHREFRSSFYSHRKIGATGGIFNLDFNADGSILGAACEQKNVLLFDPFNRKVVGHVEGAHQDCVNIIRFFDSRVFATCSDDTTVALWDARYLKAKLRTLRGHSNWVKNIEFSKRDNLLVTSGFDGAIYTWNINRYSEREPDFRKVFYTTGLMRMRLTRGGDKMVVSTTNGFLMIVHDLNLDTIETDLANFKPNMYRLMQVSGKPLPVAARFTSLFHAARNRVEFISDFPEDNEAEVISSLQLHPHGWVAVSRNVSTENSSEWCCVHDIHSEPVGEEEDELVDGETQNFKSVHEGRKRKWQGSVSSSGGETARLGSGSSGGIARLAEFIAGSLSGSAPTPQSIQVEHGGQGAARSTSSTVSQRLGNLNDMLFLLGTLRRSRSDEGAARTSRREPSPSSSSSSSSDNEDDHDGAGGGVNEDVGGRERDNRVVSFRRGSSIRAHVHGRQGFILIPSDSPGGRASIYYFGGGSEGQTLQDVGPDPTSRSDNPPGCVEVTPQIPQDARLHHNRPHLTHFMEESNQGRGYIKEVAFSPDGRIIASPFGHGIRLLAFDPLCRELPFCTDGQTPKQLHELSHLYGSHKDVVLASAFSPNNFNLVTGCLAGKIVWHQPEVGYSASTIDEY